MNGDRHSTTPSNVFAMIDPSKLKPVHAGPRHKLYRHRTADGDIVIKMCAAERAAASAVVSMRHEYDLLCDLDLAGIVRVVGLVQTKDGLALLMKDAGANNLAEKIRSGPFSLGDFLDIAVQLAEAIALLHGAKIVHRDINPSNIVWNETSRRATLIDFGVATTLPALTVESASLTQLEGTLAYVSPEQTGRTGRSVDSRTDLYSLGATFYELLTGRVPFVSQDPVELVHAHLARRPLAPQELNPDVPAVLAAILLKLLEKEPERRYQTAQALAIDLGEVRRRWLGGGGTISPFAIGQHDVPRELSVPEKLYGRDAELHTLSEAFSRARQGGRELVLVSGAPGIGKSALVSHLGPPVTEYRALYLAGKFDQLQRSTPFSGLSQAFRDLARQLLTQTEPVLAMWRERIEAAVSPNGQVLVDIVPEFARILGPQPPVPEFGPLESKNRFNLVFTQFLRVLAQREHPLVLFLDDLQWADAASLQLLEQWLGDATSHYLLLLGAYRDNEVGSAHPLALSLAALRDAGVAIDEIHLGPIGADTLSQLVAEAVNKDVTQALPLAGLIMRKTAGNPFFVRRLLHLLHGQGLIRFEPLPHSWAWDMAELERAPLADNVLDLLVQSIERLPPHTRTLLEAGACIGHRFDLGTLAELSGLDPAAATAQLWPALEDGLLLPLGETYKAPRQIGPLEESLNTLPRMVQFTHDRVQQAVYSLLSRERCRDIHLSIGRHLLGKAGEGDLDERLFDIVDQLDLGEALIVEPAERLRLIELNLSAARKARVSAAYHAAVEYLGVAMRHLPDRAWLEQPALTFAVHRELAECAYLAGQHARAEEMIETALEHAHSKLAKADLYSLRVLAATVAGDWARALHWGREGLAVFGLEWPLAGLAETNEADAATVLKEVGDRRIEDLLDEPEVQDDEIRAGMRLLSILGPPAYFSGADVFTFLVTRAANLSLIHGPSPYSAYAYALYAGLHNARTGDYDVGYAFGRLALALGRRFGNRAEESRMLEVFGLVVHPWKAALRDSLPLLKEGYRAGIESGELAYAAFNLNSVLINGSPAGVPLADLLDDADIAIEFATRQRNRTSTEMAMPFRQFSRALMARTIAPASFDDDDFQESRFLGEAQGNQTALGFFWVAKLEAAYLMGDYELACHCSEQAVAPVLAGNLGMVTSAEHAFYTALTLSAQYAGTDKLDELRLLHRKLAAWAEHCPENFAHKAALVGAEIARLDGDFPIAMKLYRTAIDEASRQLFLHDEALAHELRARFLLSEQEPDLAAVHFHAALERYSRWGAEAKVRALEAEYPDIFISDSRGKAPGNSIDVLALIKASQAISAERTSDRLFEQILRVVAEVAGAQKGALLLCESETLTVRARIETAEKVSVSLEEVPLDRSPDLPHGILRYVLRTKQPLVLSDAADEGSFANDPAVQVRKVRSVLCVPISNQAKLIGLLYLENETMAGVFAEELVEIVQVLAAQAAISLDNSTLVAVLQRLAAELESRVAERTQQLSDEISARDKAEAALRQAQKMEAVGQLTGGVAHDFNNLLMIITGSLDMVNRRVGANDGVRRYIDAAQQAVTRGARVTQQLLAFARRQILRPETRDLIAEVIDCEALLRHAVGETIEISIIADRELCPSSVDPSQFENALLNLAVNARDAMPRGGKLTISVRNVDLAESHGLDAAPGPYVLVSVADIGHGIAPELLDRVFEPFFSTKDVGKGSGLGLSQVYGFVKQSNGHVRILSDVGAGTTVMIYLPRAIAAVAVSELQEIGSAAPPQGSETILVVEDNPDVLETTIASLEMLGYRVLSAQNGPEALVVLESDAPIDLLFTDVIMPRGINGDELAKRAQQMKPWLKVLLTSGYVGSDSMTAGLPMLTKPYRQVELAHKIRAVLGRAR